jgi:hypothetical protein
VFCYHCIHQQLSEHQTCPVTHAPADLSLLVRLYHNGNEQDEKEA